MKTHDELAVELVTLVSEGLSEAPPGVHTVNLVSETDEPVASVTLEWDGEKIVKVFPESGESN